MKVGGQILWNARPICGTFKISCLMGELHTKGVLENHLKDQSFRLVHWLSIILSLRKTSQESINLERKYYLDCSSDALCTRVEFGKVAYWLQTLRSWRRWTKRDLRVFWKLMNLQDCVWESLPNHHEDHIAGRGNNSLQHHSLVHKFIPMPEAVQIPAAKAAVDKEWEK